MPLSALEVVQLSFADLWGNLIGFLPRFVGALLVFLVLLLVASLARKLVVRLSKMLKLDELATKLEVPQSFSRFGVKLHIGGLLGWIVKWFFIIVALIAAADILEWEQVTVFLNDVVLYVPDVLIAVIIMLVGVVLGSFVHRIVKTAIGATRLASASFLAGLARWVILIFCAMAALVQLGIAAELIEILFMGVIAMLALAGGLAFGLGGKEHATRLLGDLRRDLSENK